MATRGTVRLDDQLCFALYAATNALTRAYKPLLADIGLTYPQYLAMMVLWQDGPMPVRGMAKRLRLGPSAVTPLIDRLEQAGFVRRERHEKDHRVVIIALTDTGVHLSSAASLAQDAVVCRTGLSDDDLQGLRDNLHRLVDQVTAPDSELEKLRLHPAVDTMPDT